MLHGEGLSEGTRHATGFSITANTGLETQEKPRKGLRVVVSKTSHVHVRKDRKCHACITADCSDPDLVVAGSTLRLPFARGAMSELKTKMHANFHSKMLFYLGHNRLQASTTALYTLAQRLQNSQHPTFGRFVCCSLYASCRTGIA